MSIVVVGSVAFDDIASPSGSVKGILGGPATYFSLAASHFTQVRMVAVVGDDFGSEHEEVLKRRGVDTRGIERARSSPSRRTASPGGRALERAPRWPLGPRSARRTPKGRRPPRWRASVQRTRGASSGRTCRRLPNRGSALPRRNGVCLSLSPACTPGSSRGRSGRALPCAAWGEETA